MFVVRWFDKSIQLIVTQGGHAAINFEHAWGDGVAVLRFLEELYNDRKHQFSSGSPTLENVTRLELNPSPQITEAVADAKNKIEKRCKSLSFSILEYHKYGKNFIKSRKLSPDSLMQLAIQVRIKKADNLMMIVALTPVDSLLSSVKAMCANV